ncbi:MAG: winged helix-turn-helix transcriptional regulator [Chloroflexi bacterium]|nr:winged helix-turn-helix transcriptional regulator [Chloroflexota bacterium]
MPDWSLEESLYALHAEVCKALAEPKRLRIITALRQREMSVAELSQFLNMPQPNLSHHLAILRRLVILNARRDGIHTYYSLSSQKVLQACDIMREVLWERLSQRAALSRQMATAET